MAGVLKAIFEPRTNCAAVKHANRWATNTLQPPGKRCSHHARTRALWTHSLTPFTLYHRLSNRLDNRLNVCLHDAAYCSTGCSTGLTTGWTTGCIVYTNIQPAVKPVEQPIWQPVISCKWGLKVTVITVITNHAIGLCWYEYAFRSRLRCGEMLFMPHWNGTVNKCCRCYRPKSPARGLRSSPPACTASLVVGSSKAPWPWPWPWIGSRSNQHIQYM